jgi:hypothetical protein
MQQCGKWTARLGHLAEWEGGTGSISASFLIITLAEVKAQ